MLVVTEDDLAFHFGIEALQSVMSARFQLIRIYGLN
jgi:hypothetical protein